MPDILTFDPITVQCLSPVHIGTGERLRSLDFVWDRGTAWVVDPDRLLDRVGRSPQVSERFVDLAAGGQAELSTILRELRIRVEDVVAYRLAGQSFPGSGILTCIKTADRRPFIPGSSLKGAVRGVLGRHRIQEVTELRSALTRHALSEANTLPPRHNESRSRALPRTSQLMDAHFSPGNPQDREHYALFRVFGFADTAGAEPRSLELGEVRVLSVGSDGLHDKRVVRQGVEGAPMRLNAEVIGADTVLEGRLALYRHLLGEEGPVQALQLAGFAGLVDEWVSACNVEARRLMAAELEFFRRGRQPLLVEWYEQLSQAIDNLNPTQCLLRLGWGSGFDEIATLNLLDPSIHAEVRRRVPLGKLDGGNPVYPFPKSRKVIYQNGQPVAPLGWVVVTAGTRPSSAPKVTIRAARVSTPRAGPAPAVRTPGPSRQPGPAAEVPLRRPLPPKPAPPAQPKPSKLSKAAEKAKREQERIRRKYSGEEEPK